MTMQLVTISSRYGTGLTIAKAIHERLAIATEYTAAHGGDTVVVRTDQPEQVAQIALSVEPEASVKGQAVND